MQLLWLALIAVGGTALAGSNEGFPNGQHRVTFLNSETVLSGVDVFHSTIQQAIEKLGEPSRITEPGKKEANANRSYEWYKKTCWLRIVALRDGTIKRIDVWGARPDSDVGTTGRGLELGASLGAARRIYGLHFTDHSRISAGLLDQCASTPILEADFDKNGHLEHIGLTSRLAVCY